MMDGIKACVEAHREEALAFLKKLISCDTTDYHEVNGQIEVEKFLRTLGAEICRIYPDPEKLRKYTCFNEGHTYDDRYCLVGMIRGEGEGRSILLNAHMDTVFPASPMSGERIPLCLLKTTEDCTDWALQIQKEACRRC